MLKSVKVNKLTVFFSDNENKIKKIIKTNNNVGIATNSQKNKKKEKKNCIYSTIKKSPQT